MLLLLDKPKKKNHVLIAIRAQASTPHIEEPEVEELNKGYFDRKRLQQDLKIGSKLPMGLRQRLIYFLW